MSEIEKKFDNVVEYIVGSLSQNKCLHSKSVADYMYEYADGPLDYKEDMYLLGLIHDIGYIQGKAEGHAKYGGNILHRAGYKYWREVYYHGNVGMDYSSKELDLLNSADLQIDYMGKRIGYDERLSDIKRRYGEESKQYKNAFQLMERLRDL